jgi:NADPH:quinone reductase-like Zn-dependent oxidoreductase
MKAIVYYSHGSPDVLRCEEIEKPAAADNQVLIRVRAVSVNPLDWHMMRGRPLIARLAGRGKPKPARLGFDVAGQIEAAGGKVTRLKPGDEVFGGRWASGPLPSTSVEARRRSFADRATRHLSRRPQFLSRHSPHCKAFATKRGFSRAGKF